MLCHTHTHSDTRHFRSEVLVLNRFQTWQNITHNGNSDHTNFNYTRNIYQFSFIINLYQFNVKKLIKRKITFNIKPEKISSTTT